MKVPLCKLDSLHNIPDISLQLFAVSRPTTKLGWDIQKLIEAHVSGPVMMGNFKSSTDEYPDEPFGQQFSAWKSQKAVHVPEVDLRHNSPPLPALKKTIPPTAGLNVESISNVKTAPLTVHASENGSSGDNKVLFLIKRFFLLLCLHMTF